MKSATLEIVDWSFSAGGEHLNGTITWTSDGKYLKHKLEHKLSEAQARSLNKKERARDTGFKWHAGDETCRYWTKEELYADAKAFCEKTPEIDLLTEGGGVMPVVFCRNEELGKILAPLGAAFEALYEKTDDPWKSFPADANRLEFDWGKALLEAGWTEEDDYNVKRYLNKLQNQ